MIGGCSKCPLTVQTNTYILVAKKILGSSTENQSLISCAACDLNVYLARLNSLSWLTNGTFDGGLICNWISVSCSPPVSIIKQGVVTYMSPVETFVTRIKIHDRQKVCLIVWSSLLKLLIVWFLRVKGQIGVVHSWSFDYHSSEVTLIPW